MIDMLTHYAIIIFLVLSASMFMASHKNNHFLLYSKFMGEIAYILLISQFLARSYVLDHIPVLTFYDTLLLTAIVLITIAKIAEQIYGITLLKIFSFPLSALFILIATFAPDTTSLTSEMRSTWLMYHVVLTIIAYGCFSAAFLTECMYLLLDRFLKQKKITALLKIFPPLDQLKKLNYRIITAGFVLLTAGMIFGAFWSNVVWGSIWLLEHKLFLTALIWIVYFLYLYQKYISGYQGKIVSYLNLVGFVLIVCNYFLIRLFDISGLHQFY